MICAFASALSSQSPAKILSGNYHPPAHNNNLLQLISGSVNGERALPISGDALTVALDVVQIWAVMLTISFTLIIFFFLAFCVCAKRENCYDDFDNCQGIKTVKVCRNGGEIGAHIRPTGGTSTLGSPRATDETSETSSRYTHQRELPAIPTNASSSNRESLQTRPVKNDSGKGGSIKLVGGVQVLPAGAMKSGGRAAVVKESVVISMDSQDGGATKNIPTASAPHSYVMVSHSKEEHAYAKVVRGNEQEPETDTDNYDDPEVLSKDLRGKKTDSLQKASNLQTSQSIAQNRCSTAGGTSDMNSSAAPDSAVVIQAAMAISGRTRANEELPYMTPPALQPSNIQQQQNYSGDSHDSRGYTSISVREPLAALKARQQLDGRQSTTVRDPANKRLEPESEGYYMTVSDDSADETYACIDENSRNGGSETYARINLPTTTVTQNAGCTVPQLSPTAQESFPPAPPSVDSLKHVVHSRQASAGSAASTGLSSPNAERRATKSPLPPVPQGDSDLYSKDIVQDSAQKQTAEGTGCRPLEEMYAKVNKKRSSHSRGNSSGVPDKDEFPSNNSSRRNSADVGRQMITSGTTMSSSLIETSTGQNLTRNMPSDISMSWSGSTVCAKKMTGNTKTYSRETSDPGYETVKSGDPTYASVGSHGNYPSYEVVRHQGISDLESEHGYETLRHKESEPGYETVQEINESRQSRYSNREVTSASDYEAGYETVNRSTDAGYESVPSHRKDDYDPGYEELSGIHARTISECDPNYEQLKFNTSNSECGYEAISKGSEGNYELVSDYRTQEKIEQADTDMPLYATVNKKSKISPLEAQTNDKFGDETLSNKVILKNNETEHISLIQVTDVPSQDRSQGDKFAPLITGAIIKCNQDILNLGDSTALAAEEYPIIESPEDVELPPPDIEEGEAVASAFNLIPVSFMAQDSVNLLGSLSEVGQSKPLDVDLITGCYSTSSGTFSSLLSSEDKVDESTSKGLSCDTGIKIDLLSESLPPPPASMIDDISTQVMPLPPPVDDICGNQDLFSQHLLTNSSTVSVTHPTQAHLLADFADIMQPPPINGSINGLDTELHAVDLTSLMDVPPPPQLEEMDASLDAINSTITVTVNPMAHIPDSRAPPPISSLIRAVLSSESSGSTANGGSVESVVTVDVKNGIEVSTSSVSPTNSTPQTSQPTSQPNSNLSDVKDGNDGLTPV